MFRKSFQVKISTGQWGEKMALQYLRKNGYELVTANYYVWGGELDLIVKKNGILIFVEVKTRTSLAFGTGEEALTRSKKQKLLRAIFHYLGLHPDCKKWQLDLISIQVDSPQKKGTLKHFKNIFAEA